MIGAAPADVWELPENGHSIVRMQIATLPTHDLPPLRSSSLRSCFEITVYDL